MNHEVEFILSEEQIFKAEQKRAAGRYSESAQSTQAVAEFPMEKFQELTVDAKQRLLMAVRINESSKDTMADMSLTAPSVARHLREAKEVIENVYHHPEVQKAVKEIKTDTRENPYEFGVEMLGDEVSYLVALWALTQNSALLDLAGKKLDRAVELASEQTAKTLMEFRKARIANDRARDWESYRKLKASFESAVIASLAINRFERVSTVAARFALDSLKYGHLVEGAKAIVVCGRAALQDRSTITIFPREVFRALTKEIRHFVWRKTSSNDYSYLQLRDN